MKAEVANNEVRLLIEKDLYGIEVLYKCFYWYSADFDVDISTHSVGLFEVVLHPKGLSNLQVTVEKIKRDLIDFKLRDIVATETKTIRELLIAKAFAHYGMDDDPKTHVSDPVGFDPNL